MRQKIIQELVKLADSLDSRGFIKEADMVDYIIRTSAEYACEAIKKLGEKMHGTHLQSHNVRFKVSDGRTLSAFCPYFRPYPPGAPPCDDPDPEHLQYAFVNGDNFDDVNWADVKGFIR